MAARSWTHVRRRARPGAAAGLATVLWLAGCVGAKPPPSPPAPPTEPAEPYAFLVSEDPVARAMATIWRAQFARHADPAAASAALAAVAEATAVVAAERERAVGLLMPTLLTLLPDDSGGHLSLDPLLRLVAGDPEIVGHFRRLLLAPPVDEEDPAEGAVPDGSLVQAFALDQLVAAGERGSERARESLLEILARGHPEVLPGAVQAYYRISSDRRLAQRTMRRRLPPDRHYLLYRY